MKFENKEEWLELVINYDACGIDAFEGMELTDKQKEVVACAHRDMRCAEEREGDKDAEDFCDSAKNATYGWMKDFNENEAMYMHVDSGSVDSYDGWVDSACFYEEEGFASAKDCVDSYISENKLIEVRKDSEGEWKEV